MLSVNIESNRGGSMKARTKIIIILSSILFISLIIITIYYFSAFNLANNLLISANKNPALDFQGSETISVENYDRLSIVGKLKSENTYINGGFFPTISKIGIVNITILFKGCYQIIDSETGNVLYDTGKQNISIVMSFKERKWVVTEVSVH